MLEDSAANRFVDDAAPYATSDAATAVATPEFAIEKWYADAVDDTDARIFYRANARLGATQLGYARRFGTDTENRTRLSLGRYALPHVAGDRLHWPIEGGARELIWTRARSQPIELWRDADCAISWDPIVLNGEVSDASGTFAHGYAERLIMNFAPWRLGLSVLRWGRFCGKRHHLVWIQWYGRVSLQLAVSEGRRTPLARLGKCGVRLMDGTQLDWSLAERRVLVDEAIGTGALRMLGWCVPGSARRFLAGRARKWLTSAALTRRGERRDDGHAIYEEVTWS
jgi:hypothetical protein